VQELDAARLFGYNTWKRTKRVTARAVKTAFDLSVIAETDLWGGDKQLWDKISQSRDPAVAASVKLILRYRDFVLVESKPDESKPTVRLQPKIRTIESGCCH
jgi:hypothetical protein